VIVGFVSIRGGKRILKNASEESEGIFAPETRISSFNTVEAT
jgi:hypothetical protein